MYFNGHIGKIGTGSLGECASSNSNDLSLCVENIRNRRFGGGAVDSAPSYIDGHVGGLAIIDGKIKWYTYYAGLDGGGDDFTVEVTGKPIAVFTRCALTDKEVVVFWKYCKLTALTDYYDIYEYDNIVGTISSFDDSDKGAYLATPNGDVYYFDIYHGTFSCVSNFGNVVKIGCLRSGYYDSSVGDYFPSALILNADGDLYYVVGSDPNSITLVKTNVVGLGAYIFSYCYNSSKSGLVFTTKDGKVYLHRGYVASDYSILASDVPGTVFGAVRVYNYCTYSGNVYLCYRQGKNIVGAKITDWSYCYRNSSYDGGYKAVPVAMDVSVPIGKAYMAHFFTFYLFVDEGVYSIRYVVGLESVQRNAYDIFDEPPG